MEGYQINKYNLSLFLKEYQEIINKYNNKNQNFIQFKIFLN